MKMFDLKSVWQDIAARARFGSAGLNPDLSDSDAGLLARRARESLAARGGEVSARARAAEVGRLYLGLSPVGRRKFWNMLATEFGPDRAALEEAIEAVRAAKDDAVATARAEQRLHDALRSGRVQLLTQFTALPDGFKFLVDMRAEVLDLMEKEPELLPLEQDLQRILTSWFDIGFLELRQITWQSPAALLEKLVAYEAVHEIRSWGDLKNRLGADRRCYAFFHPRMPDEPLIFIEVALVNGLAGNIQDLLDEHAPDPDPQRADTAIFYSISNTQKGLRGISFGNFLIKRVVDCLSADLPNLRTFSTLSPIPGFRRWLDAKLLEGEPHLLAAGERQRLQTLDLGRGGKGTLKAILDQEGWHRDEALADALEAPLMRLCARYLLAEKRGKRPIDPVARFHLSNGARVECINWLGDTSPKGIRQSAGMMVNYLYRLRDIEKNHEAFVAEGTVVASPTVRSLAGRSVEA